MTKQFAKESFKGKYLRKNRSAYSQVPEVIKNLFHLILVLTILTGCHTKVITDSKKYPAYQIGKDNAITEDTSTEAIIRPYRIPMQEKMNEVLVKSQQVASKSSPESVLGDLVCDLLIEETAFSTKENADVCLMNKGGLRIELPKGDITRSMIYELMPFENELVLVELNGDNLLNLLNQVASRGGEPIAGVRMKIKNQKATEVIIGNTTIQTSKIYKLLTSDYIFNGGDKFIIPASHSVKYLNLKVRDALLQIMERKHIQGLTLNPHSDGRIVSE